MKSHYLKIIDLLQPETVEDCDTQLDIIISVNVETIANRVCEFTTATMAGCHNGVVASLKRITPSAIGVHCAAHIIKFEQEMLFPILNKIYREKSIPMMSSIQ